MKKRWFIGLFVIFLTGGVFIPPVLSSSVPKMTKDELNLLLGNPDLMILDVRRNGHWTSSDLKIRGAVRENPNEIELWANKYSKDKKMVLYCA